MVIKLSTDMNLSVTVDEPIYRGDILSKKITFLIPLILCGTDVSVVRFYLSYFRADGTADITMLERSEEDYNERYAQYIMPVTSTMSRYPGEVTMFLTAFAGAHDNPIVMKSGTCTIHILASTNMDEYISDRNIRLIYDIQKQMEEWIAAKADNMTYDEIARVLQLQSDGENIGDAVTVPADDYTGASVDEVVNAVIQKLEDTGGNTVDSTTDDTSGNDESGGDNSEDSTSNADDGSNNGGSEGGGSDGV